MSLLKMNKIIIMFLHTKKKFRFQCQKKKMNETKEIISCEHDFPRTSLNVHKYSYI